MSCIKHYESVYRPVSDDVSCAAAHMCTFIFAGFHTTVPELN